MYSYFVWFVLEPHYPLEVFYDRHCAMYQNKWKVKFPQLPVRIACPTGHGLQRLALHNVLGRLMERERRSKTDFNKHSPGAGEACPAQAAKAIPGTSCHALQVATVSQTDISTKWPEQKIEASLLIYKFDTDLCPTWTLGTSASLEENNR